MKQVGVNLWAGLDPYTLAAVHGLERWKKEDALNEKRELEQLSPCERFRYFAKKKMKMPMTKMPSPYLLPMLPLTLVTS